jgi:hypothetical protein
MRSRWGNSIDANPVLTGLALVALGLTLVGCAIVLGG